MPIGLLEANAPNRGFIWKDNLNAIIGTIDGIIVLIVELFKKEIIKFITTVLSIISGENVISNYFKSNVLDKREIDFFFYQLGLRKNLPIMDLLYFEYIKFLSKTSKIRNIIIFPIIDMSELTQQNNDFNIFCKNVNKVFNNSKIEINIIDPYQDIYFYKEDLVSKDFIETLKYIGSKKYFDYLRKVFKIRINSITDFNKFHPIDDKIKNIYTHINKSWSIINYIKKNVDLSIPVNISAIFWEWEVDKLGVMKHYTASKDNIITFFPVLGITQMLNKTTPIPAFSEGETICIFDNIKSIIEKAIKVIPYIKKYNLLLESVLSQYNNEINRKDIIANGKRLWTIFIEEQNITETKYSLETKDFYLFLGLIEKIKLLVENENT